MGWVMVFMNKQPFIRGLTAFGLILGLGAFIYYPLRSAGFLGFDDDWSVYANPYVQSFDLLNAFRFIYYFDYTPVTTFYFAAVNRVFGLDPFVYHLLNVILHLINSGLIYRLGRRVFGFAWLPALLYALIFLAHPTHVESVAWITEAKDVLSVFFVLLSWLAFHRFRSGGSHGRIFYLLAIFLFFLSLGAKTISITFSVLLWLFYAAAVDWRERWRLAWQCLPWLSLSLLFAVVRIYAVSGEMELIDSRVTLPVLFSQTVIKIIFYFSRSLFPYHLAGFYENGVFALFWYEYLLVPIFLGIVFAVYRWGGFDLTAKRQLLYFTIFTVIALTPMLKIVPWSVNFMVADRYLYFPSIGLYALFALLLGQLSSLKRFRGLTAVYLVLMMGQLTFAARERVWVWHNDFNLWRDVLEKYPGTAKGLHNLSVQYLRRQEFDQALALQKQLLEMEPGNTKNRINMIVPHLKAEQTESAIAEIEALEKQFPADMTLAQTLSLLYFHELEYQKAVQKLKLVLFYDPTHLPSHRILNTINQTLRDEALVRYQQALIDEFKVPLTLTPLPPSS